VYRTKQKPKSKEVNTRILRLTFLKTSEQQAHVWQFSCTLCYDYYNTLFINLIVRQ